MRSAVIPVFSSNTFVIPCIENEKEKLSEDIIDAMLERDAEKKVNGKVNDDAGSAEKQSTDTGTSEEPMDSTETAGDAKVDKVETTVESEKKKG